MNVLSLFDGMSCGQIALRNLNIVIDNYYASEVDKYAIKITQKNFPQTIQIGDIRNISSKDLPKIDLLMGGSSCQNFSFAGNMVGMSTEENIEITSLNQYLDLKAENFNFKGESYLFWEYVRLLKEVKPKYFLLENVRMSQKWEDVISSVMNVKPIKINSKVFVPQTRPRLYWTNLNVEPPTPVATMLEDVMMKLNDPLLEVKRPTEKRLAYVQRKIDKGWLKRLYKDETTEYSDCLMATMYKQLQEFIWKDENDDLRFFSPVECERLQSVEDNFTAGVSNTQRFRMLGNGWTVKVIEHILKNILVKF